MSLVLATLVSGGSALASEERLHAWETLHDARLVEAVDETPEVAARQYENLLADSSLAPDDPLRGILLLALGEARIALGNVSGAEAALRDASKFAGARSRAEGILARLAASRSVVRSLPYRESFDGVILPSVWIRAGETADRGPLALASGEGDSWLAWNTRVERTADRVSLSLAPGLRPARGSLRVRPERRPARILVRIVDGGGGSWDLADVACAEGVWTTIELSGAALRASAGRGRLLELVDHVGEGTSVRGTNLIRIDDVEIR